MAGTELLSGEVDVFRLKRHDVDCLNTIGLARIQVSW